MVVVDVLVDVLVVGDRRAGGARVKVGLELLEQLVAGVLVDRHLVGDLDPGGAAIGPA